MPQKNFVSCCEGGFENMHEGGRTNFFSHYAILSMIIAINNLLKSEKKIFFQKSEKIFLVALILARREGNRKQLFFIFV
jgi:hypothetical protein